MQSTYLSLEELTFLSEHIFFEKFNFAQFFLDFANLVHESERSSFI